MAAPNAVPVAVAAIIDGARLHGRSSSDAKRPNLIAVTARTVVRTGHGHTGDYGATNRMGIAVITDTAGERVLLSGPILAFAAEAAGPNKATTTREPIRIALSVLLGR